MCLERVTRTGWRLGQIRSRSGSSDSGCDWIDDWGRVVVDWEDDDGCWLVLVADWVIYPWRLLMHITTCPPLSWNPGYSWSSELPTGAGAKVLEGDSICCGLLLGRCPCCRRDAGCLLDGYWLLTDRVCGLRFSWRNRIWSAAASTSGVELGAVVGRSARVFLRAGR